MKHTTTRSAIIRRGGEEIPSGTFHGGEEIPAGTFHGGLVQCPHCKHWFAADSYAWAQHRRSCTK